MTDQDSKINQKTTENLENKVTEEKKEVVKPKVEKVKKADKKSKQMSEEEMNKIVNELQETLASTKIKKKDMKDFLEKFFSGEYFFNNVKYPYMSEKVSRMIDQNTICFVASMDVPKPLLKLLFEKYLDVKIKKINILIDKNKTKKVYLRLAPEYNAQDIVTELGLL